KSFFLITLVIIAGYFSWQSFEDGLQATAVPLWYLPAVVLGFITCLIIVFKKTTAPYLAPVYAILQGSVLGALSSFFESQYSGIVLQAVVATAGVFVTLLLAYKTEIVRATENFKLGVVAATGGIAFIYIISFVLSFFGKTIPYL